MIILKIALIKVYLGGAPGQVVPDQHVDKELEKGSEIASVVVTALATVNKIWKRQMQFAHTNAVSEAVAHFNQIKLLFSSQY